MKITAKQLKTAYGLYRELTREHPLPDRAQGILRAAVLLGAAAAVPVLLLAPGKAEVRKKAPFLRRNYAHRGLHTSDNSVPENSLPAFRAAAEAGYGMELDVRLTADGEVVVCHDDNLQRVCGLDRRVEDLTLSELRELRLFGTEERIPLFTEVLETVDGRMPLIVELKPGGNNPLLCEKTAALLDAYPGDACIESFHPLIVAWFRFHAPQFLRGQLAMPAEDYLRDGFTRFQGFLLSNTLLNAAARPQFIAYRIGPKSAGASLSQRLGALRFGWTSREPGAEQDYDAVIFEFYRPQTKY